MFERKAQFGRQKRRIGGREQAQPGRGERGSIDPGFHFSALRKTGAQKRQAFDSGHALRARNMSRQAAVVADRAVLVHGEIPRDAAQLIVDVQLERVARGDIHRGEQRADQKRDETEGQKRPSAENPQQPPNHRLPAAVRLKSSGFRNVNSPFHTASGAMTSPSFELKVTPAGCTIPVDRPLIRLRGGTSPSSATSSQTPMNPSLPVFHGDGSSTSGSRPARGLSMLYGGRYSLLIAAT